MYVYFIRAGSKGAIKIGVAKNVEKRMAELQIGNAFELNVLARIPCPNEFQAYELEKKLHHRFKRKRVRGEWFLGIDFNRLKDCKYEKQEDLQKRTEQRDHEMHLLADNPL